MVVGIAAEVLAEAPVEPAGRKMLVRRTVVGEPRLHKHPLG